MRWVIVTLFVCSALMSWAQSPTEGVSGEVTDTLHGFKVNLPQGWTVRTFTGLPVFIKEHHFVLIGATAYQKNLNTVLQQVVKSVRLVQASPGKFAVRRVNQGLIVAGEGLAYPYGLDPGAVLAPAFTGVTLPERYSMLSAVLKGQGVAFVVMFLFPAEGSDSLRKEMVDLVRRVQFLPAGQRVAWKAKTLTDPMLGGATIATIHVPEGWSFQGGPLRQGTKYWFRFAMQKGQFLLRLDLVDLANMMLSTPFGGNATSVITLNGQSAQMAQPVFVQNTDQIVEVITALWQAETGQEWKVVEKRLTPVSLPSPGNIPLVAPIQREAYRVSLIAESGDLLRMADGDVTNHVSQLSGGPMQQLGYMLYVSQCPKEKKQAFRNILAGVLSSLAVNPNWSMSTLEVFTQTNKELNDMVREMTSKHQEFNSQMARAWSNALSDQTYARDPQTGEVFKLYKRVWDTDNFWRSPVFGKILGTIGQETDLGKLLKMEGWRTLQESLSGTFK